MGTVVDLPPLNDNDAWASWWFYTIGVNVRPQPTKSRDYFNSWKEWQDKPIPDETFEEWKREGKFRNAEGMAIILGEVWRGDHAGKYFGFIDCDNGKAIVELCTALGYKSLDEMAKEYVVEQHADDPNRAHIYCYTDVPLVGKSSDKATVGPEAIDANEIPAYEVKGEGPDGMAFCTPSLHKYGQRYKILGVAIPGTLSEYGAKQLMQHINSICEKAGLSYLGNGNGKSKQPVAELFKKGAVIYKGHNRHKGLLKMTMSLVAKNRGTVPLSTIKEMAFNVINPEHCDPPLDRKEFETNIWPSVLRYIPHEQRYEDAAIKHLTSSITTADDDESEQGKILSVSEALVAEEGYRAVHGTISTMWLPYHIVTGEKFLCRECTKYNEVEYDYPLPYTKWGLTGGRQGFPKCESCGESKFQEFVKAFTMPAMNVELMDTDTFEEIKRITVILTKDQMMSVKAGERVTIRGELRVLQNRSRKGAGKYYPILYTNDIEYEDRDEIELTSKDINDIKRFVDICKQRFGGDKGIIERLVWMHSPEVVGNNFAKRGLLFLEVSTGPDIVFGSKGTPNYSVRKRINGGLFGPPGHGKSMLLRASVRHVPNSRYESGQNSSGLSLTAMVQKDDDNYMLRVGPAAHAKGAICAINEAGWLKFTDQSQLLDVMEEGFFTVNKHGFNARIRADTSILISANPKFHAHFSESSGDKKVDIDELPLLKQIVDRLDLMLIFKPAADERTLRDFVDQKSEQEDRPAIRNYDLFLRKLISYCRSLNPKVDHEARSILNEAFIRIFFRVRQNNLPFGSHRIRDTLFRITRAIAKLKLKKVADKEDAKETIEFYNSMVEQTIGVIAIPESSREVAVNIMLDILKKDARINDISLKELAYKACLLSPQVASYVGPNHSDTGANNRLREIGQILLNHSSVIKGQKDKPLTLRWVDKADKSLEKSSSEKYNLSAHLCICQGQSDVNIPSFQQEQEQQKQADRTLGHAQNEAIADSDSAGVGQNITEEALASTKVAAQIRRYADRCDIPKEGTSAEDNSKREPIPEDIIEIVEAYEWELAQDYDEGIEAVTYEELYNRLLFSGKFTPLTAADAIYDLKEKRANATKTTEDSSATSS